MYPGNQKGGTIEHKFLSQILASAETQQISEPHSVSGSTAAWQKLKTGQEINGEGMVGGRNTHIAQLLPPFSEPGCHVA